MWHGWHLLGLIVGYLVRSGRVETRSAFPREEEE